MIAELLRFLRNKANTPARIVGMLSVYVALALQEGTAVYSAYLVEHREILLPMCSLGFIYWGGTEIWEFVSQGGHLPVRQADLLRLQNEMDTIAGRQARLADTIGEAYWETDASGRMIFSNYANAQLYGTTAREIVRSGTAPYIHKNDLQNAYRAYKQATEGQMGFSVEFDVVDRGSYVRSLRVYAWPLFEEDGTFMGHYGSVEATEDLFDGNS